MSDSDSEDVWGEEWRVEGWVSKTASSSGPLEVRPESG